MKKYRSKPTVDRTESPRRLIGHIAIPMKGCIVVFGGKPSLQQRPWDIRTIWLYNLYTDHWKKDVIPRSKDAPEATEAACAAAIASDIYMFGGETLDGTTNMLWQLTRSESNCFEWNEIQFEHKKSTPSPRCHHSGWEHGGKLWIFGGCGRNPTRYLFENGHGNFIDQQTIGYITNRYCTNQLLYFDPLAETWTNPKCTGQVPSPRSEHATARIKDAVWLYGGTQDTVSSDASSLDDMYELNMHTLLWTKIEAINPRPPGCGLFVLTAIADSQLVLHGGHGEHFRNIFRKCKTTWFFDIPSQTWRQSTTIKDPLRYCHTGSRGINKSVIIIGGQLYHELHSDTGWAYRGTRGKQLILIVSVMLEPNTLQQVAMKTVYQHYKDEAIVEKLPKKLTNKILGTEM